MFLSSYMYYYYHKQDIYIRKKLPLPNYINLDI
nr:MAG TPA: hypothetical protein [Bacteriophage sp.]